LRLQGFDGTAGILKEWQDNMSAAAQIEAANALAGIGGDNRSTASLCAYRTSTVGEIVNYAATGEWNLPAFQRGFIWKIWQICDIADSLWRDYPIGPLLLWRNYNPAEPRVHFWVADGQHRIAALCLIFGLTPAWWREKRKPARPGSVTECALMFDASAETPPYFVAGTGDSAKNNAALVPVRDLLRLNPYSDSGQWELESIAGRLCRGGLAAAVPDLCERLARVSLIREKPIATVALAHLQQEDILEVFRRQNGRGIRFRRVLMRMIAARLARCRY
jgi:hypothetical protein